MRVTIAMAVAALVVAAAPAKAQLYVTGVTATTPDPNGKVPAFNAVPGAGIATLSTGFPQAVLTHGQSYNYCVNLASANTNGKGQVSFSLKRGATVIQKQTIVKSKDYSVGPNGVWFYCSGYLAVPNNPGAATLTGSVSYLANGSTKHVASHVSVQVVIE